MRIIDLSHTIAPDMPVYPGTLPPTLSSASTFERDRYRETALYIWSHVGTHIDAPAHLFEDGVTLDRLSADRFYGEAVMLDCTGLPRDGLIPPDMLPDLTGVRFLILRTGLEHTWGTPAYYGPFPTLSPDAARIVAQSGLSGIGVDAISFDPVGGALPIHRILLGAGMIQIENLCSLDGLPEHFTLCAFPPVFLNADGAPTRAVAILP
jgi:arylformamidase